MKTDTTEAWIRDFLQPRYPELVAPYRKAEELCEVAKQTGLLPPDAIATLLVSARSVRTPVGESVSGMIGELADRFDAARDAIRQMAGDTKVHVRVNALVALESHSLSQLHRDVLASALRDRSARVRSLAADKIMCFGLSDLLPDLEAAIGRETKAEVQATLKWGRDLLLDGYRIEEKDDGRAWVTCRTGAGVVSTSFSIEEMETRGREWIAQNARPGAANNAMHATCEDARA